MKIFYYDLSSYLIEKKVERKKLQSTLGRYIVSFVAKTIYGVEDTEIIIENKKPKFLNSQLCFNISHSNNIVAVAFDDYSIGFDVECMKDRDYKAISQYLKVNLNNKKEFYQYWTQYEAKIKIQDEVKQILCFELCKDYMCSLFSSNPDEGMNTKLKIYELISPIESISPIELINLNPVNANNKNENTLVAQERNTASVDFLTPLALKTE